MKLHEINQHHDVIDAVVAFAKNKGNRRQFPFSLASATVNVYGSVDIRSSVYLNGYEYSELPFRFGKVEGNFDCTNSQLTSMKNFPVRVDSYVSISGCEKITSLEGLPQVIGSTGLILTNSGITSLEDTIDIFKNLRFMGGAEVSLSTEKIKRGGISLIFAKNISHLWDPHVQVSEPFKIIEKYLGRPDDIFECQAELIDNGFEEYAQL